MLEVILVKFLYCKELFEFQVFSWNHSKVSLVLREVRLVMAAMAGTSIRTRFGTQFHEREYLLALRVAVGLTSR